MYYKIYTDIRDSAWQCLIDNGIDRLPVDMLKIARQSNIDVKKNSNLKVLLPGEYAKSFYNGDKWVIIYNDLNDTVVSRFAIAHELGHIFLNHVKTYSRYATIEEIGRKPKSENQADTFALRLLCPACVLKELDAYSAEEIAECCRVPIEQAQKRSKRLKELKGKNKYLTSDLEKLVARNFSEYIALHRSQKYRKLPIIHI